MPVLWAAMTHKLPEMVDCWNKSYFRVDSVILAKFVRFGESIGSLRKVNYK